MNNDTVVEKKQPASHFETACRDCCFAKYVGKEQTGCAFNLLDKYRSRGVEIVEATDGHRDFFVVKTACRLFRYYKGDWARLHPGRERKAIARKEIQVQLDVVIVYEAQHTLEQLALTLESLKKQQLPAVKVTVVVNRDAVQPASVIDLLSEAWEARFVMERRADGTRITASHCVDLALADRKCHFYSIFTPGCVVPPDFVSCLDVFINDELEHFLMLEPNSHGQGLTVQKKLHEYYGGNTPAVILEGDEAGQEVNSIEQKIRHRVRHEDTPDHIRRVEEVCPAMENA